MGAVEEFTFDLNATRVRVSSNDIIDAMKRLAARRGGRAFGLKHWDAWKDAPCCSRTVIVRFGSWRTALQRAGIQGGRSSPCDIGELMDNLERVWRHLGRPPGNNLIRRGEFSASTYRRYWGSVRRACERLAAFHKGQITREQLLEVRPPCPARHIPPNLRHAVLRRDRFTCVACGASRRNNPSVRLQVDHIKPVAKGGTAKMSNLRTLCRKCNQGKGAGKA